MHAVGCNPIPDQIKNHFFGILIVPSIPIVLIVCVNQYLPAVVVFIVDIKMCNNDQEQRDKANDTGMVCNPIEQSNHFAVI